MSLPELSPLLDVRGVQQVTLLSSSGETLASAGDAGPDLGIVGAARAVLQSLQAATETQSWNDLLLDLETGPLLLTPTGDNLLLVKFDEVPSLGRVRLGVRRVLS